jgi:gluconolactonase
MDRYTSESAEMKSVVRAIPVICVTLVVTLVAGCAKEGASDGTDGAGGSVTRIDQAIDELVPVNTVIEKVAEGFVFTEGPVWMPGVPGRLLFSDIPANKVYSWSRAEGLRVYLEAVTPPDSGTGGMGGSNGLALDMKGRLILCEHGNRRIARMDDDGSRVTLADRYDGRRLNSPNDIVMHSSGAAFFTDPPYGLEGQDASGAKEQPHNGVYRLDVDGTVTLLVTELTRPNGIALSPDERMLYVANSDRAQDPVWMAYPVLDGLQLGDGAVFFNAREIDGPGSPDGMAVDQSGNVYATGPGGILIISPGGEHLGTIVLDEVPANVAWGDDGSALYATARTSVYRITLSTRGLVGWAD